MWRLRKREVFDRGENMIRGWEEQAGGEWRTRRTMLKIENAGKLLILALGNCQ